MKINTLILLYSLTFIVISCQPKTPTAGETLFTEIPPNYSRVDFVNQLEEDTAFNILNYLYFFNGGGVGIGDFNNDSLPDVYFSANMGSDKLYLNKGDFQFEDITEQTQIKNTEGWSTGVNVADVNGDGLLDICVAQVTAFLSFKKRHNLLFINQGINKQGIPTFEEQAKDAGVAHTGFSTQSAFFDYDLDGDLDLYLLNHSVHTESTYGKANKLRFESDEKAGDKLYRNDSQNGSLQFTEVTKEAGILNSQIGYGLGLSLGDVNSDGYPDIYVGNDFHENDYLYLNNGDGTFSEQLTKAIGHTSRFSMGVDIADLNNDALPDILSLDMKPNREDILKTSAPEDAYDIYQFKLSYGYHHQLAHNALQLNQGVPVETQTPLFSEVAEISGIPATDWSWSVLAADYNLDGLQDIFISNGIYRRPNDMDYIKYISENNIQNSLDKGVNDENLKVILKMPSVPIANVAFQQKSNGSSIPSFEKVSNTWGLGRKGFSNGAAWADLDLDGDLDLVLNNLNAPASIYRNEAVQKQQGNWLNIQLEGEGKNTMGIGAKVIAYAKDNIFLKENFPVRGFQSSVESGIHFGLGEIEILDSLRIVWQNGASQLLTNIKVNAFLRVKQSEATTEKYLIKPHTQPQSFSFAQAKNQLAFTHSESDFIDFTNQQLIPHMLSTKGPCIATADVNGDGITDVYVGGANGQTGKLFLQNKKGEFITSRTNAFKDDIQFEDVDAIFFDADGDQDNDLYIVSGGSEPSNPSNYIDRLFLNDGKGFFTSAKENIPRIPINGSCVEAADIDADGDIDLFVGGLSVPGMYGFPSKSSVYLNDGRGKFSEATKLLVPELNNIGMVSDAVWVDLNSDNRLDLVIAGEWMPITYFVNGAGSWKTQTVPNTEGLWQHLNAIDANGDGNMDIIAGNMGENSELRATKEEPIVLFYDDFDGNSQPEQIISLYRNQGDGNRNLFPLVGRDALTMQMPSLKKRFFQYSEIAEKGVEELFPEKSQNHLKRQVKETHSVLLLNTGTGTLTPKELPNEVQVSPVMASIVYDFNQDGKDDILLGGNLHGVAPAVGRYDASYGSVLLNKGNGKFQHIPNRSINLWLRGEIRSLKIIDSPDGYKKVLVGRNDDKVNVLSLTNSTFEN